MSVPKQRSNDLLQVLPLYSGEFYYYCALLRRNGGDFGLSVGHEHFKVFYWQCENPRATPFSPYYPNCILSTYQTFFHVFFSQISEDYYLFFSEL